MNQTRFASPYCHRPTERRCQLDCPSQAIMDLATIPKSQDNVLSMPEFWEFFSLLCLFWLSQSGVWAIQDPVCLDLIGKEALREFVIWYAIIDAYNNQLNSFLLPTEKPNDFGKQRCWTSIGWGTVSMLSGWLVDYFSTDTVQKNYTPLSYLIFTFMVLNLIVASNITVQSLHVCPAFASTTKIYVHIIMIHFSDSHRSVSSKDRKTLVRTF